MTPTNMTFFEVGEQSPVSRGYGFEGNVFQYDASGYHLYIFLRGITPKEANELRHEVQYHFSLLTLGSAIFVLHRLVLLPRPAVGRFCERVIVEGESPYSWHLVHPDSRPSIADMEALSVPSRKRALVQVTVVDSLTNLVHAIRFVTPSPAFTAALHVAAAHQAREAFDARDYERQVQAIYRRHTTKQLLRMSSHHCIGGQDETADPSQSKPTVRQGNFALILVDVSEGDTDHDTAHGDGGRARLIERDAILDADNPYGLHGVVRA